MMSESIEPETAKRATLVQVGMERRRELLAGHVYDTARANTVDSVYRARLFGATWDEIADALGMSKQAAHRRFAEGDEHGGDT